MARFKIAFLGVIFTAGYALAGALGCLYGAHMELLKAVAEEAAYYHPRTGRIMYGTAEQTAIAVAVCQLYANRTAPSGFDCSKVLDSPNTSSGILVGGKNK